MSRYRLKPLSYTRYAIACVLVGALSPGSSRTACAQPEPKPPVKDTSVSATTPRYTLEIKDADDPQLKPVVEGLQKTFQDVYPKLVKRFNNTAKPAPKTIVLSFEKGMDHPAHASGSHLTFSTEWFVSHPDDLACLTHELTHIVQHYPEGEPGWLVEGIADYSRQIYGPNTTWKLPSRVGPKDNYTSAYRVTARFLLWIEKKYDPHFVDEANKKLQQGSFKVEDFKTLTGKTVEELWTEYAADTTFKVEPATKAEPIPRTGTEAKPDASAPAKPGT